MTQLDLKEPARGARTHQGSRQNLGAVLSVDLHLQLGAPAVTVPICVPEQPLSLSDMPLNLPGILLICRFLIPGSGLGVQDSAFMRNGNPLQHSCLEKSMD